MWSCSACSCEGGWGGERASLEKLAAAHVCVASSDHQKLISEADALIDSWDRRGSWTSDSPVGMVMRLRDALSVSQLLEIDEQGLERVIDVAQRRWGGSGRHEPISVAITRAVVEHLRGDGRG